MIINEVIIGGEIDVSEFVTSVKFSGDTNEFYRELSVTLSGTKDGRSLAVDFDEGESIEFKRDSVHRFKGVIFKTNISSDGKITITSYDPNAYLKKSNDSRIFINKKASEIATILCKDFGISYGTIADTGYVIPYLKLTNKTLSDMILKALTLTYKQTGKRYFVGNKDGKLILTAGAGGTRYVFKDGANLIDASYTRSINDTKTQVKVTGGAKGKETVVVVKDDVKRAKYGVLQIVEEMDEKATAAQVKQRAQTLLKEKSVVSEQLNVRVLGVPEVDVGTPVYIINEMTRTNSGYYVTMCDHDYSGALHTMSLELTKTLELPSIEVSDDETKKETVTTKKASTKKKTTTKKEATKK